VGEELLLEEKLSRLMARRWCLLLLLAAVVGLVAECCCRCSWWRRWSAGWSGGSGCAEGKKIDEEGDEAVS
jgi:hypothetical protein